MSTTAKYSIKDLETLSNIKSHTIRIWEKRYDILNPERTDTNIRFYTNEDLKKLLNISFLNKQGIKISKIVELSDAEINEAVQALNLSDSDNETFIENLIVAMIDLNEDAFQKVFNAAVDHLGFEVAIKDIIFKFFQQIGVMWQVGAINPAQEHFVSNIVRQKIIVATEELNYQPNPSLPKVLLFLPENELHELSLLMYNYALRKRAYETIYLGQAVPLDSLERILEITQPNIIISLLTNSLNILDVNEIVIEISKKFSGKILISGYAIQQQKKKLPAHVEMFKDLDDLILRLESLV
ncbi:MAG TPA: MerR family transcriptional regulator [Chitinophagales bacterium]|nr:MerR family transcriptional regulator [Chitinophagales bacterium]